MTSGEEDREEDNPFNFNSASEGIMEGSSRSFGPLPSKDASTITLSGIPSGGSVHDKLVLGSTAVQRIAEAEPGDVHEIAASQIELISDYHNLVISQSQKSFWVAVTAGGIGFAFLLSAIIFFENSIGIAAISGIAAAIAEIFAAVFYRLHSRALGQFSDFNERLELIQRYLLANSIIVKHIEGEAKEQRLSELVRTIAKIQHSPEKEE